MSKPDKSTTTATGTVSVAPLDAPPPPAGEPDRYPTLFALMREHDIDPGRVLEDGFGIDGYRYLVGEVGEYRNWSSPELGHAMIDAFWADLRSRRTVIKPYRLVP